MVQSAGNIGIQGPAKSRADASQARVGASKRKAVAPGKRQHVAKDPHPVAKMSDNRVSEVLEHIFIAAKSGDDAFNKRYIKRSRRPVYYSYSKAGRRCYCGEC